MSIGDIHLKSTLQNEMSAQGRMAAVVSLATVAFGIVLIACFNFMNLSTARSVLRGKEVGIRKTIGAERKHLVLQFMGESLGMALLATVLAMMLVEIMLPAFNGFSGKALEFDALRDPGLQAALGLLVLVVGVIAGSYPALDLAAQACTCAEAPRELWFARHRVSQSARPAAILDIDRFSDRYRGRGACRCVTHVISILVSTKSRW